MRVCKEREREKFISLREKFILVNYRGLRQAWKLDLLFAT